MITHYFITAFRNLWKYKVQNLIGIAGLAAGLFCFSICLYYYFLMHSIDNCYEKKDRLVNLIAESPADEETSLEGKRSYIFSLTLANELREQSFSTVEAFCQVTLTDTRLYSIEVGEGEMLPYELTSMEVDTFYNQLFTPEIYQGSWEAVKNAENAVILSRTAALRIFGEKINPIGRVIRFLQNHRSSYYPTGEHVSYVVLGVMEDLPPNISASFFKPLDMIVVNDTEGAIYGNKEPSLMKIFERRFTYTYALLRKGVTAGKMQQELNRKESKIKYCTGNRDNVKVLILGEYEKKSTEKQQWVALVAGGLVLLAGLFNFYYFLIVSFQNRMHEYAVRMVLGGNYRNLFALLGTQTSLTISFAGLLVAIIVEILSPYLHYGNIRVESDLLYSLVALCWGMLGAFGLIICACVTFLLQHRTKRRGLSSVVKKGNMCYIRNIMLGFQFFICFVFFACTIGLHLQGQKILREIWNTLSLEEKRAIIKIDLNYDFLPLRDKEVFIEKIKAFSGVKTVSLNSTYIADNGWGVFIQEQDEPEDSENGLTAVSFYVDSCFLDLVNLPVLSGRIVGDGGLLFNEKLAKRYVGALGNIYRIGGVPQQIVSGITGDVVLGARLNNNGFPNKNGYIIFQIGKQKNPIYCYVKAYPDQEKRVKMYIEQELRKILPESMEMRITTLEEDIAKQQFFENNLKDLILFFSIICILITILGVYSSVTLDTDRRQKEMAIRKVNGAKAKDIALIFMREYIVLLLLAASCAFPVVHFLLKKWFESYSVTYEYGLLFWMGIFFFIVIVVGFTIFFKVQRIARVNPASIIRNE